MSKMAISENQTIFFYFIEEKKRNNNKIFLLSNLINGNYKFCK